MKKILFCIPVLILNCTSVFSQTYYPPDSTVLSKILSLLQFNERIDFNSKNVSPKTYSVQGQFTSASKIFDDNGELIALEFEKPKSIKKFRSEKQYLFQQINDIMGGNYSELVGDYFVFKKESLRIEVDFGKDPTVRILPVINIKVAEKNDPFEKKTTYYLTNVHAGFVKDKKEFYIDFKYEKIDNKDGKIFMSCAYLGINPVEIKDIKILLNNGEVLGPISKVDRGKILGGLFENEIITSALDKNDARKMLDHIPLKGRIIANSNIDFEFPLEAVIALKTLYEYVYGKS